jgi:hypothetical protein
MHPVSCAGCKHSAILTKRMPCASTCVFYYDVIDAILNALTYFDQSETKLHHFQTEIKLKRYPERFNDLEWQTMKKECYEVFER